MEQSHRKNNMKRYLQVLQLTVILCFSLNASAQRLVVGAPTSVSVGENFRLTYRIATQNVSDFKIGNIPSGFEVITGPYESSQSSYQVINGHTSSSSSITYTYILCAVKNGVYTIPSAHIQANGRRVSSKPVRIRVTGTSHNNGGAPRMHESSDDQPRMRAAGSRIGNNDLFIKVSASKRRVYEQVPVLLTYKVYTLVDLTQLDGKMPDLTGFHTQEIPLPQQKSFHLEKVNGRNYRCVTWSQYVMYPQMTGKLSIPKITFTGTVVQQNRNIDPFEAFFNGGSGFIEVKRAITAPGVTIQVDPLPAKPSNFSGGVGKFTISAQIDKKDIRTNDPITIRVVVGGVGNLKLLKQPIVNFPKDFDRYDAKVTDKTKLTTNGVEGNMIYDFMAVPRNQGDYVIPGVELVYFDTSENSYKTIKTQPFRIHVAKGNGVSGSSEAYEDLKNLDIRQIKEGDASYDGLDAMFYGSYSYWALLSVLFVAFVGLLIVFRKRSIDNANIIGQRIKKANNVASRRLKDAYRFMLEGNKDKFFDEILKALLGYVSAKFNIPQENLTKDNMSEILSSNGVGDETVSMFIKAVDGCEYGRYANGDDSVGMGQIYELAMRAIIEVENTLKGRKKTGKVRLVLIILMLACFSESAFGITKKNADDEYKKGNYQQAIKDYEDLLKKGASSDIYYNLGNAYYRTDNITRAVINYERALLLSPEDKDIRLNLQIARSKTIDKITPKSEMFFVVWYRALASSLGTDGWACVSIVSIVLTLLLVLCYLFGKNITIRKTGFYMALLSLVVFLFSNIFAYGQRKAIIERTGAIIIAPSVYLLKTPANGSGHNAIVHEGCHVEIMDDTMKDWVLVELPDGREGWVKADKFERI